VGGLGVALFVIRQRTYCDTGEGARLGDVTHLASTWRMSCFDASLGIGEEGCSHGWIVAQTMPPRRYAIYIGSAPAGTPREQHAPSNLWVPQGELNGVRCVRATQCHVLVREVPGQRRPHQTLCARLHLM